MKTLPSTFFDRKTLTVAKELVGKTLVREVEGETIRQTITETEAYVGPHDLACHSSKGRTPRCEPMFGPAGTIYVYFTYGMHWMLNIVTEEKDFPAAVLIRGTSEATGPARLTKALKIDKSLNGKMLGKKSGLWIEEPRLEIRNLKLKIARGPRIGVSYAGEWAKKPYRFVLKELRN
jgi:DNA-3-methyladenine glycosylase